MQLPLPSNLTEAADRYINRATENPWQSGPGAMGSSFSPLMLLPIIFSFLQSTGIFGGNDEDEAMEELLTLTRPRTPMYQSPNLQRMDPVVMNALLNQLKRTANWGWPAGQGMDLGFLSGVGPLGSGLVKKDRLPPSATPSLLGLR